MKTQVTDRNKILLLLIGCSLLLFLVHGCYDSDDVGDSFYTFTGETVGSYLEAKPETYSEFAKAIKKAELDDLLKTYNKYTCFAPTNKAMQTYYNALGKSSLEELSDSAVRYMVYSHMIAGKEYKTTEFFEGALSTTNMNSRYLVIGFKAGTSSVDILINTNSTIVERDIEVENGIIHSIDRVLTPSTYALPALMGNDERITLFVEALEATGLDDSMQWMRDETYIQPAVAPLSIYPDKGITCRTPKERKIGYTCFVESNDVLAAAGITDLESMKNFAAQVYNTMYPEDAGITDTRDRRNSLNRFIAYHLIDKTIHYNNFFYKANMVQGVTLYEFMETFCPNTIFRVSNDGGEVFINRDNDRNVPGIRVLPIEPGHEQDTENGIYHLIDNVLTYNQKVRTLLLNTRIRVDAASLHPEMMTNGYRYEKGDDPSGVSGDDKFYFFPDGFLKNVEFVSNNTRLYYLQGSNSWCNYQADEMMALGQFDFIMRLPPVPAGTYEIRFGYTANNNRGILQFYVDGEPQGIPLNMKKIGTDPVIGWMPDGTDGGVEVDKMMRNRGYMKGGTSYKNNTNTGRTHSGALRRIVCTKTWDYDGPHYLRFKSVSANGNDQFMIDYFEYVPKNLYAKPDGTPEPRD
jgi:uncharacterized surface protein with fasciclin (FAS1) repeats